VKNAHRLPTLFFYYNKSAEDLLNRFFISEELKEELYSYADFLGSADEDLSAVVFFAAIFAKFTQDSFYIRGGSGALTQLMDQEITRLGGTIALNTPVEGFRCVQGHIAAIRVGNQDTESTVSREILVPPKAHVLFCSDPPYLMRELLPGDALPPKYKNRLKARQKTESLFVAYVGLDFAMKDIGFGDYIYELRDRDDVKCSLFIYSNLDPGCAPPGKSNIQIIKFMAIDPFSLAITADGGTMGPHYRALKHQVRDMLIDVVGNLVGMDDFRDHIVFKDAATPVTFQRYTNNTRGSFAGYVASFKQSILSPISIRTPIRNLWLAGQWIYLGGGFQLSLFGGIKVAEQIDRRLRGVRKR